MCPHSAGKNVNKQSTHLELHFKIICTPSLYCLPRVSGREFCLCAQNVPSLCKESGSRSSLFWICCPAVSFTNEDATLSLITGSHQNGWHVRRAGRRLATRGPQCHKI